VNTLKVLPLFKNSGRIVCHAMTRNTKISEWSTGAIEEGHAIWAWEPSKLLSATTWWFFIFLRR